MKISNVMQAKGLDVKTPTIDEILDASQNVATILQENHLNLIAKQVIEDFDVDHRSMSDWLSSMKKGIELASQEIKQKHDPWPNASNVKHSLILEACIQFASRALPEFVKNGAVVKSKSIGPDPENVKSQRGKRVERFMNYELMDSQNNWEDGFDRLLMILPMVGTVFKKTYYCPVKRKPQSVLCFPDTVTINQSVDCLQNARRITHKIPLYGSDITTRVRMGAFLDVELNLDNADEEQSEIDPIHEFLEQHRYLDLDGDGYAEPYIVTVHKFSEKVVRIVPDFGPNSIEEKAEEDGAFSVVRIERDGCFSDYHFIRSVDGTFFSYGFGYLLSHATHTINTILNQLIDAGTLDNRQSGFIGKGARIPGGQIGFKPGEWKRSESSGIDLKSSIVPLPTKGPSATLLSLVQFLLASYYKMISISEIMSGQISGSNTTAAEAMQAVEQGMKVMNSIHTRVYRGLSKELMHYYRLIRDFVSDEYYNVVLDEPETASVSADFESVSRDLVPVADPKKSSQMEEVMRLRMVLELSDRIPEMQRAELGRRFLEALRVDDIDAIIPPVDPNQPTPQQQAFAEQLEQQADALQAQDRELRVKEAEVQLKAIKVQYEVQKLAADTQVALTKARKEGADIEIGVYEQQTKRIEAVSNYIQAITPEADHGNNRANSRMEESPSNPVLPQ